MAVYRGALRYSDEVVIQVIFDDDENDGGVAVAVIDETTGETVIEASEGFGIE